VWCGHRLSLDSRCSFPRRWNGRRQTTLLLVPVMQNGGAIRPNRFFLVGEEIFVRGGVTPGPRWDWPVHFGGREAVWRPCHYIDQRRGDALRSGKKRHAAVEARGRTEPCMASDDDSEKRKGRVAGGKRRRG